MVSAHIRRHIVGYLALFFALTGSAAALKKNTVTTKAIKNSAVTASKLANGAVTGPKVAQGSIASGDLAAGAVNTSDIAPGAVTTSAIAAGAVTPATIAPLSITGAQLNKGALGLGPESFGAIPAVRALGDLTQTAPAIVPTTMDLDTDETQFNVGGFGVGTGGITVPRGGVYHVRTTIPWGEDSADDANRTFVTDLNAGGDLVDSSVMRATQPGFNYGPSTDASALVELQTGDLISAAGYYSGTTPSGEISFAGFGPPVIEAYWIGPAS